MEEFASQISSNSFTRHHADQILSWPLQTHLFLSMADVPRKRSRFDQMEPEPRRSRHDNRSRSPSNKGAEGSRRSRSPGSLKSPKPIEKRDPAAAAKAAAAAAAKINASLQAKKGIQHVDVPPIRSVSRLTS